MTDSAYGLDIGLTNGSLVKMNRSTSPRVDFVFRWSTPQDLDELAFHLVNAILEKPAPVAIDWTPTALYRRTPALQLVRTGYLVGEITFGLRSKGITAIHVPTWDVRKALGLRSTAPKEDVHAAFFAKTGMNNEWVSSHTMDAIILAWLLIYHAGDYQGLLL